MKAYRFSSKKLNGIWIPSVLFMVLLMAASTWNLFQATVARQKVQDRRILCGKLSDNLDEAAGYLSDQARNYVITGEPRYLENYWDEVYTGRRRESAVMELEKLELPKRKMGLLTSAKNYSDLLIYLETRAMRLAADSFGLEEGEMPEEMRDYVLNIVEKSMNPEERHMAAVELLFGNQYLGEKEVIGQYISQFLMQTEEELDGQLKEEEGRLAAALTMQWVLQAAAVLLFLVMILSYYYLMIRPVLYYHSCLEDGNKEMKPSGILEVTMLGQAMSQALKAKDEFLATVSHELRTPLNSVIGYETLLEQTGLDPLQKEYVSCMQYASEHLTEMVNHILDYTRLEKKQHTLSFVKWNPQNLVHYLDAVFSQLASSQNLEFHILVEKDMPAALYGDEVKIRQIAANLVSNALKFTKTGEVMVNLRFINHPLKEGEGTLILMVKDTGPGIGEQDLERIFKPFEQAGAAADGLYGGIGLGLSICQSLSRLMGGTVRVSSRQGLGSTFTAELPQHTVGPEEKEFPVVSVMTGRRVLLAEDNQVNQYMQAMLLTSLGLSVEVASNGKEALELFKTGSFDLILMDLRMPEMDGYETAERIRSMEREEPENLHIPIIALTADGDRNVQDQVDHAGMDAILVKPVALKALKEEIGRFIKTEDAAEGGQYEWREELLHIFCKEHAGDFEKLVGLGKAGQYEAMKELLHLLKGASATAGVSDIKELCVGLEERLKDGKTEEITEKALEIKRRFEAWQAQEGEKEEKGLIGKREPVSGETAAKRLKAWRNMVAMGEFGAIEQWKANQSAFFQYLGEEKATALWRALARYDYQEVLILLDGEGKGDGYVSDIIC